MSPATSVNLLDLIMGPQLQSATLQSTLQARPQATPSCSAADRSAQLEVPEPMNRALRRAARWGGALPSGDWDSAKEEVREQMRILKNRKPVVSTIEIVGPAAKGELHPRKNGVASCKLARMRAGLKPSLSDTPCQDPRDDSIVTM